MPPCLLDLSTELQFKIIEQLVLGTDPTHSLRIPRDEAYRKVQGAKRDRFLGLMNWSCISNYFRNLIAPYVYETVILQNKDEIGSSLIQLAKSPYSKYVRRLQFVGSAPGDVTLSPSSGNTEGIFPETVNEVLSNLGRFPNLGKVGIFFDYQFGDSEEWEEVLDLTISEEDDAELKMAEENSAWRALMAKTYSALAKNKLHHVKALEIMELPPRRVSTFDDEKFHAFLGQLDRFSLSIYGADNGACWQINKNYYYEEMMPKLDRYLLDHLNSVTAFTLKAPEEGPLGLEGTSHVPLGLSGKQMPMLRTLYVEYIFVCPALMEFLLARLQTLEHVSLHKCAASTYGMADNGIPWCDFLNALADANPKFLAHFEISPMARSYRKIEVPMTDEEEPGKYFLGGGNEEVVEEVKKVRRILEQDQRRKLFAYVVLDDKYGFADADHEENLTSFQRGEDQKAFDRLMRIVHRNAIEGGRR